MTCSTILDRHVTITPRKSDESSGELPVSEKCELKAEHGIDALCDGDVCLYWRAVEHLGGDLASTGCAVQALALLEKDPEVAEWLLTVKKRVEAQSECGDLSQATA